MGKCQKISLNCFQIFRVRLTFSAEVTLREKMFDDTIAAISTPAGEGGIGHVRLTGKRRNKNSRQAISFFKRQNPF